MLNYEALGLRLKLAREQVGMTQTEAAAALGLTSAALSQYKSGKRKVEALTLESLSRLYAVPLGYFFGEDAPLADWEVALRSLTQNLSPQAKAGISQLIAQVHNLEQLYQLTSTAYPGIPHPPFRALAEEDTSNYEVAEYAYKARRHYDLGMAPILDLRQFLLAVGSQIFVLSFGQERDAPDGLFFQHPQLGSIIAINAEQADSRRCFTLAHTLAHSLYHYDRPAILCDPNNARPIERFAHRFASYFLIPPEALHSRLRQMNINALPSL
jgi:transcriptional regulator with XRE-family HTH domain